MLYKFANLFRYFHLFLVILPYSNSNIKKFTDLQLNILLFCHIMKTFNFIRKGMSIIVKKNIILIGFMGTGKSMISAYLHQITSMPVAEMDEIIVQREGMSIPEIFSSKGDSYFRSMETALLKELQLQDSLIISCGGGAALRQENVQAMKTNGIVFLLSASAEVIFDRIGSDLNRPVLDGRRSLEGISQLMQERQPYYEAAADYIVSTDDKSAEQIAQEILHIYKNI